MIISDDTDMISDWEKLTEDKSKLEMSCYQKSPVNQYGLPGKHPRGKDTNTTTNKHDIIGYTLQQSVTKNTWSLWIGSNTIS